MEPARPFDQLADSAGSSSAARRIDHVAIAVRDADLAARWYVERLGLHIIADELVEAAGVRLTYLAGATQGPEQAAVQLVQPVADGAVERFVRERGEGLHHVCFSVDDLNRTLHHLGEAPDGTFQGGRGRRACFLSRTPNNALIELTETDPVGEPVAWSGAMLRQVVDRLTSNPNGS